VIPGPREALITLSRAGEEGGILLRTEDGGDTWEPVLTSDSDLYHVQFLDGQRGWLAGSHATLWRTDDGGKTWQEQPNPQAVTPSCLAFAPGRGSFGLAPQADCPLCGPRCPTGGLTGQQGFLLFPNPTESGSASDWVEQLHPDNPAAAERRHGGPHQNGFPSSA
jgi:hypothetical protein